MYEQQTKDFCTRDFPFTGKYIGTRRIGRFDLTLSLYVHKNKKQVLHFDL